MESHPGYDEHGLTVPDPEDVWAQHFADAFTDNIEGADASSVTTYLRTMELEHREQCEAFDIAATSPGRITHALRADAERRARYHGAIADAYSDALRVIDIAHDSAYRIATRRTGEDAQR